MKSTVVLLETISGKLHTDHLVLSDALYCQ